VVQCAASYIHNFRYCLFLGYDYLWCRLHLFSFVWKLWSFLYFILGEMPVTRAKALYIGHYWKNHQLACLSAFDLTINNHWSVQRRMHTLFLNGGGGLIGWLNRISRLRTPFFYSSSLFINCQFQQKLFYIFSFWEGPQLFYSTMHKMSFVHNLFDVFANWGLLPLLFNCTLDGITRLTLSYLTWACIHV